MFKDPSNPPTFAAVVVTYNRVAKLRLVMDALMNQTRVPDRIFVIDNASTDETPNFLRELSARHDTVVHVRLGNNEGGAGGFHEGLRIAYEAGHDLIWVSDDDAYPDPDALELLVDGLIDFEERFALRPSFACSAVRWTDRSHCEMNTPNTVWDWPRFYSAETPYLLVGSCSFVSVLIPRWAVKEHGLPLKEYFIWYDDAEYSQRLSKSYPGIFCPDSVVVHDVPENKGVNYSLITEKNLWKYKYGARNETSFRLRENGFFSVAIFLRGILRQMKQGGVRKRHRLKIVKSVLDGLIFRPKIQFPKEAPK